MHFNTHCLTVCTLTPTVSVCALQHPLPQSLHFNTHCLCLSTLTLLSRSIHFNLPVSVSPLQHPPFQYHHFNTHCLRVCTSTPTVSVCALQHPLPQSLHFNTHCLGLSTLTLLSQSVHFNPTLSIFFNPPTVPLFFYIYHAA